MRQFETRRETRETDVFIQIGLDGRLGHGHDILKTGSTSRIEVSHIEEGTLDTSLPFLDHMLAQVARHGRISLTVVARGDTEVDYHHLVEDVGIAIGESLAGALGAKNGVQRYGCAHVPLDESLSRVVIDLSGRSFLEFNVDFVAERVGLFDTNLIIEFFDALVRKSGMTLHIDGLRGRNAHHQAESIFKAFAVALRQAMSIDPAYPYEIMSTKGSF